MNTEVTDHILSSVLLLYFIQVPGKGTMVRSDAMLEQKDFATGCLTILLCVLLVPLFFLVFKLTLMLAVFLALVTGVVLGITVVGRIVRFFITGK